jgi:ssDNA-binding Zn-finger/Zn-ribbon topoisomerase 1
MRLAKDGRPIRKLEPPKTELSCGKCKHPLLVRVSARGKREPRAFLSCSNFPRCRAAEELPAELAALGELALKNWRESDEKNRSDWEIMRTTMKAAEEALPENGGGESEA